VKRNVIFHLLLHVRSAYAGHPRIEEALRVTFPDFSNFWL
jgi:hypothetical protein